MRFKILIVCFVLCASLLAIDNPVIPQAELTKLQTECTEKNFESCYYLGLIRDRSGKKDVAMELYDTACKNGFGDACVEKAKTSRNANSGEGSAYLRAKFRTLSNGLRVGLISSKLTKQVDLFLQVDAGTEDERPGEFGLAWVTQNAIFQDPLMARESYLDELKRHYVDLRGYTDRYETYFEAKLPDSYLSWFVTRLTSLFGSRNFNQTMIEKSAENMTALGLAGIGFGRGGAEAKDHDFNKSEFGLSGPAFSLQRILGWGTSRDAIQVQSFFGRYYHPKNMRLFVVGNFDEEELFRSLESNLKALSSEGKETRREQEPILRDLPYEKSVISSRSPYLTIGTKLWKLEPREAISVIAYLDHLESKITGSLHSEQPHTYTVSKNWEVGTRNFGKATVTFDTTDESFDSNLQTVQHWIDAETQQGHLSTTQLREIRDDYLSKLGSSAQDLTSLMGALRWLAYFEDTTHTDISPLQWLKETTPEQMKVALQKAFNPRRRIEIRYYPPIFFPFDTVGLFFLSIFFASLFCKWWIKGKRDLPVTHFRIAPSLIGRLAYFSFLVVSFVLFSETQKDLWLLGRSTPSFIMSRFGYHYLYLPLYSFSFFFLLFYASSFILKSFWIEGDRMVFRGNLGRRKEVPFTDISEIDVCGPFAFSRVNPRHLRPFFLSFRFSKGVRLQLKSGKMYFIGVNSPEEIAGLLKKPERSAA